MKNLLVGLTVLFLGVFTFGNIGISQELVEVDTLQLENSLEEAGLTTTEVQNVKAPVSEMIANGAQADEIIEALKGFRESGLKGRVLLDCTFLLKELNQRGKSVSSGREFILTEARTARDKGISGKNLVLYIKKAML